MVTTSVFYYHSNVVPLDDCFSIFKLIYIFVTRLKLAEFCDNKRSCQNGYFLIRLGSRVSGSSLTPLSRRSSVDRLHLSRSCIQTSTRTYARLPRWWTPSDRELWRSSTSTIWNVIISDCPLHRSSPSVTGHFRSLPFVFETVCRHVGIPTFTAR